MRLRLLALLAARPFLRYSLARMIHDSSSEIAEPGRETGARSREAPRRTLAVR